MLLENCEGNETEEKDMGWDYNINDDPHDYGHNLWVFLSDPLLLKSYDPEDDDGY